MTIRERAIVLVDGPALVHRWFHSWSYSSQKYSSSNSSTNNSNVDVKKFTIRNVRYILATAHSFDPSHLAQHIMSPQLEFTHTPKHNKVIFCFDQGDGGRRAIYTEYKKNRELIYRAPELMVIEKVCKRVLREEPPNTVLVLPDWDPRLKTLNAEADDMIATIALYNQHKKIPTVVMTHDYDLYQLVDHSNKSYHFDLRTKHLVSERAVMERIGVHPKLVRDYKALAGDASDNIPGIKGIGKIRAQQLLKKYGDLEGVLSRGVKNQSGRLGELLREGADSALLSRQLVDFRMCPKIIKTCETFLKGETRLAAMNLEKFNVKS